MKKQAGFTLVELMIAGLIGIFLIASMMNLFIATNKSVTLSDGLSQNQETGRFAMDYITNFIRTTGYSRDMTFKAPPIMLASGNIDCTGSAANACAGNDIATIRGDRLSLPYVIGADETFRSCTGTSIGGAAGQQFVSNVFWVSSNENNSDRELRCRTYDISNDTWLDNTVSILSNVDQLHFQVGLASSKSSKAASSYVSIDNVTDLNLVRSIRVGILTTSADAEDANKIQSNITERKYNVLDGPTLAVTDGSVRNIFTTTVELPNAIESGSTN